MSREETAREVLKRNEWLFEQRKQHLRMLARTDPYRHPPNQRTWWDWEEIRRREAEADPGRLTDEQVEVLWQAVMLSGGSLQVCEALLRNEAVPLELLDAKWVGRFGFR